MKPHFSQSWPSRKLGDICRFFNGGTPSRNVDRYFSGNVPWITGADINSPEVTKSRFNISEEAIQNSATNKVPAGTILLVTRTGVGKVALAGVDLCFSQDITALQPESLLHPRFLLHLLRTKAPYFEKVARGATIKGITRDVVANLDIPLPPLEEQKRIADILDRAEALREKRRASLALLDSLTQSIFLDMFGDPASNPKQFPMPELAKGINLRGGFAFKSSDYVEQGIPLVRIGEVNRGGVTSENASFLPATYEGTLSRFVVRPGDLLMSLTGTTGKDDYANVVLLDSTFDRYFLNQRVALIEPKADFFDRYYLLQVFRNPKIKASLTSKSRGIRQANISNRDVTELKVPSPPIALQREFAARLSVVEKLRARQVASLAGLDSLFASLQHRAFIREL